MKKIIYLSVIFFFQFSFASNDSLMQQMMSNSEIISICAETTTPESCQGYLLGKRFAKGTVTGGVLNSPLRKCLRQSFMPPFATEGAVQLETDCADKFEDKYYSVQAVNQCSRMDFAAGIPFELYQHCLESLSFPQAYYHEGLAKICVDSSKHGVRTSRDEQENRNQLDAAKVRLDVCLKKVKNKDSSIVINSRGTILDLAKACDQSTSFDINVCLYNHVQDLPYNCEHGFRSAIDSNIQALQGIKIKDENIQNYLQTNKNIFDCGQCDFCETGREHYSYGRILNQRNVSISCEENITLREALKRTTLAYSQIGPSLRRVTSTDDGIRERVAINNEVINYCVRENENRSSSSESIGAPQPSSGSGSAQ